MADVAKFLGFALTRVKDFMSVFDTEVHCVRNEASDSEANLETRPKIKQGMKWFSKSRQVDFVGPMELSQESFHHMRLVVVGIAVLHVSHLAAEASPVRVEGTTTYELFTPTGVTNLRVEEGFSMLFEAEKWLLSTELLESTPPMSRPEVFAPPRQEAGSDGKDSYYLKTMSRESTPLLSGWVEQGSMPDIAHSPSAALLWLACCADSYLEAVGEPVLRPFWAMSINSPRQSNCLMRVAFQRSADNQLYLLNLEFLSDGRVDPCNPSADATNMRVFPWSEGYTQAVFRVEEFRTFEDAGAVPGAFVFEAFSPVPRTSPARLRVFSRIRGVITNATMDDEPASWLPALPDGSGVGVKDFRFTEKVTNWATVSYRVTNRWNERSDQALVSAITAHENVRSKDRRPTSKSRTMLLRSLIAGIVVLPLIVVVWSSCRRRAKRMKETKKGMFEHDKN